MIPGLTWDIHSENVLKTTIQATLIVLMLPDIFLLPPGFVKVFPGVGHAAGSSQTLAQRPCGHINKRQFLEDEIKNKSF